MFSDASRTLSRIEHLSTHPQNYLPPKSLERHVVITRRVFGDGVVFDVSPHPQSSEAPAVSAGVRAGTRRAVYLHGGCYCFEITTFHWRLIAQLVRDSGVSITVPIVPLAPRGTASVVVQGVADLTESLIADVGASNVSVIGDSSGGGMALATAMMIRRRSGAQLHSTVLIAPWLDVSGTDPMLKKIAPTDPWLAVPGTHAAGALYRAELEESDWRVSPLFGDFDGLGAITLVSGTRDIVYADALRMVPKAREAGVAVDWVVGEGMVHVYPLLPIAEAVPAREAIVRAIA